MSICSDQGPLQFTAFRQAVLDLYRPPIRAKATRLKMAAALDSFARVAQPATVADLTTQSLAAWVAARKDGNVNTTISLLRALRVAVRYAAEEGWIERLPSFRRVWPRGKAPRRKRELTHDQVVKLLAQLEAEASEGWKGRRLYVLSVLIAYSGVRLSEACFGQIVDLDLDRQLLWISGRRRLKTEESAAPVPVAAEACAVLASWLPEAGPTWLFPGARRETAWWGGAPGYRPLDRLQQAAARAGLEGVTFHGLRHTLGTLLVGRWGRTKEQTQWILRHANVRTTEEHYIHDDDAELLRSIVADVSFKRAS